MTPALARRLFRKCNIDVTHNEIETILLRKCEPMLQILMEDETGHSMDPYVQMLLEEPEFHSDGTRVVYDALHWALKHGISILMLTVFRSFKRIRCTVQLVRHFEIYIRCFLFVIGTYDARVRVILHSWATDLFGLTIEHFEMLEDAIIIRLKNSSGYTKTPE